MVCTLHACTYSLSAYTVDSETAPVPKIAGRGRGRGRGRGTNQSQTVPIAVAKVGHEDPSPSEGGSGEIERLVFLHAQCLPRCLPATACVFLACF